jgi:hypothetical protein
MRFTLALALFVRVTAAHAQDAAPYRPGAPPAVLLFVHQQFLPGQASARARLEEDICRGFDRLGIPVPWIELWSVTGAPEALYLDPMPSHAALERAGIDLAAAFAARPELAALQERGRATIASERTVLAERRLDLGYRVDSLDFARARYVRVNTFRLKPGHDGAFEEVARIRANAYAGANANLPWAVYQVNAGTEGMTYVVLLTLRSLAEYDSLAEIGAAIEAAQGKAATRRLAQLEQDAFAGTDSELYVIQPTLSHVLPEFAAADSAFWHPRPSAE